MTSSRPTTRLIASDILLNSLYLGFGLRGRAARSAPFRRGTYAPETSPGPPTIYRIRPHRVVPVLPAASRPIRGTSGRRWPLVPSLHSSNGRARGFLSTRSGSIFPPLPLDLGVA